MIGTWERQGGTGSMSRKRDHLGPKIALVLKALNTSRGGAATKLRVDKSLVGRWVSGSVTPSEHNLTRLTELTRGKLSVFSLGHWDLTVAEFSAALGLPSSDEWTKNSDSRDGDWGDAWRPCIAARARHEVARYGQAYPAFYRIFRQALSNSGTILLGSVQIVRRDDDLFIRYSDGLLSYRGCLYLLNTQVFGVLGECDERDRMMFLVLNGVTAMRAVQLDGLITTVSGEKTHTPTATKILMLRHHELFNESTRDEEYWRDEVRCALGANRTGSAMQLLPDSMRTLLVNSVGLTDSAGQIDNVLRLPPDRSVSKGIGVPLPDNESGRNLQSNAAWIQNPSASNS